MDCRSAAVALCETIGVEYGPLALVIGEILTLLVLAFQTVRNARSDKRAHAIQRELAETKALVTSLRPPPPGAP